MPGSRTGAGSARPTRAAISTAATPTATSSSTPTRCSRSFLRSCLATDAALWSQDDHGAASVRFCLERGSRLVGGDLAPKDGREIGVGGQRHDGRLDVVVAA